MPGCDEGLLLLAKAGDHDALERWIISLTPAMSALSRRFFWQEDALQAGLMILPEVLKRYDVSRGTAFWTYAMPWVLGEMKKAGEKSRHWRKTRILSRIRREQERVQREHMRAATTDELSRAAGVDRADIAYLLEEPHALCMEDEGSLGDPEGENWMDLLLLRDMVNRLPAAHKRLLQLRFAEGKKQKEAAEILHTSQSGVSRMEKQATHALRQMWLE